MWITIYTDASYKKGKASYAYWIKSNHGRIKRSGVIKGGAKDITYAEMYAIYKAVKHAAKSWTEIEGVLLNCDNVAAGRSLWPWSKPFKHPELRTLQQKIVTFLSDRDYKIKFKHIKAHAGSKTNVRVWLNEWCDTNAKQARKGI